MKVLLFVQNGDERPKCAGPASETVTRVRQHRLVPVFSPGSPAFGSILQVRDKSTSDRWWLVECENAEAGRATIEHVTLDDNSQCPINCPCCGGRILASGGRHA